MILPYQLMVGNPENIRKDIRTESADKVMYLRDWLSLYYDERVSSEGRKSLRRMFIAKRLAVYLAAQCVSAVAAWFVSGVIWGLLAEKYPVLDGGSEITALAIFLGLTAAYVLNGARGLVVWATEHYDDTADARQTRELYSLIVAADRELARREAAGEEL